MARHGKAKARAKRAAMTDRRPLPPQLTMQQEARNTESHHRWWGYNLRHKAVQFVSAGEPRTSKPKDLAESELEQGDSKAGDEIEPTNDAAEPASLIDPTGQQAASTIPDPRPPSVLSAIASSSEDEVVFTGRNKHTQVEVDQDDLREMLDTTPEPIVTPVITATVQDQLPDFVPMSHAKSRTTTRTTRKQQEDDDLIADYIANIDSDYYENDTPPNTQHEAEGGIDIARLSGQPDTSVRSVESGIESAEPPQHARTREEESEAHVQSSIDVLAKMDLDAEHDSTSTSDEDEQDREVVNEDFELDSDDDGGDLDDMDIDILLHEASRHTGSQHKNGRLAGNSCPSASAFADALESDPYYGFDIMNFNRPSLRQKGRGKQPELDWLSYDSDIELQLKEAWQNDRKKKKSKKKEREKLRAQGLLGRNAENPDLKAKYADGMNMEELITELRSFLLSSKSSLSLPPMAKQRRKLVHELANTLKLKSQSRGNGPTRFPILHKTSRTPEYTPKTIAKFDQLLSGRKLNRRMFKSWDLDTPKSSKAKRAAVSYMDGDVVGASAPEIGVENRGRAMLEKMGWSTGTALGATNNKGILLPVAHVVKNTRAGLG